MSGATKVALGVLAAAVLIPAAVGQQYKVIDLGTLGGSFAQANSVSPSSRVAGLSTTTGDSAVHAFLWTKQGGLKDLGTLPGGSNSSGFGINPSGVIVGSSEVLDPVTGFIDTHAFQYSGGPLKDLGTLGGSNSAAYGVDPPGNVVGASLIAGDIAEHAALWSMNKGLQDLGTLGGTNSAALAIRAGQVVGWSNTASGTTDPFLWNKASGMQDLGSFGGTFGEAEAVNAGGQVVGFSSLPDGTAHPFLYSNGTLTDLGTFGGSFAQATGIDDDNTIVGFSNTAGDADVHAFVYTTKGGLQDLNNLIDPSLGWDLNNAYGISSEDGFIVGAGVLNGQTHAFLLQPKQDY